MKILFINLINILFFFNLNTSENQVFAKIKLDNNLQLNAERKSLSHLNKKEIYQEVNF